MLVPQEVQELMIELEEQGFAVYAVGGAVRDALRGVKASDWDLTTSALPLQICHVFSHRKTIPTGLAHGTVTVMNGSFGVEITTFRSDGEYHDHRHPQEVSFGCTLEEDLARRDFTVNAIAYSPSRGFVDPFGGRKDLARGILRCVGEPSLRFAEDALRILRALRFSSVLGYTVEDKTSSALRERLEDLKSVSFERIGREWSLLLMGRDACRVLGDYPELFSFLVPELGEQTETYRSHLALVTPSSSFWLRLAFLLTDPSRSPEENGALARQVLKRLRCKARDGERVGRILTFGREFPFTQEERLILLGKYPQEFFDFCAYFCAFSGEDKDRLFRWADDMILSSRPLRLCDLAVDGNDLLQEGFRGADIRWVLEQLLRQAAMQQVENKKEALIEKARVMKKTDS